MSKALVNTDQSTAARTGGTMIKTGAIGGGLYLVSMLPLITFPWLLVALVVIGGYMALFK